MYARAVWKEDNHHECNNYNLTSQAEEEEDEEVVIKSRNRTKKGTLESFVRNGVKVPNYPTAPRKLQPVPDPNMFHIASSEHEAMSVQAERADSSRGSEMSTPYSLNQSSDSLAEAAGSCRREMSRSQDESTAPLHRDLSKPRSGHVARGCARDGYRSRSSGVSIHSNVSSQRSWNSDGSRHAAKSRHDRSRHEDGHSHCLGMKKVLSMLVDLRNCHKRVQPASSAVHIERMETIEDFEREEQRLCDVQAFDTMVLQIARVGGKNTKDCVHKVLDRLFTNSMMAQFNIKGKGKNGKKSLEKTNIYRAITHGVMKFDVTATEDFIRVNISEHLKHAPQRSGGQTAVTQNCDIHHNK
ncbi:hypothetical protein E1301_Tti023104 [Triplophysa tibetana]|uniref:DUF4806 domain-containing protein n=1 Tax=Triplophysa tibetana TaxID=1572043 RepID=A0A5A9MW46_9TELE|nr:hypothetical protein E1301_Tti023104 [Triplophysa tibetana]